MKIQNIFALIVTLVGFAACTSESELPNTPENGELVPVTINLGSLQTRSSVDLDGQEGVIKNAVIAIFEKSSGTPSAAPIVLENGETTGSTRVPLTASNAYAFVNVSEEDIENLVNLAGDESRFKNYSVQKQLTQNANELPKFGALEFTPKEGGKVVIPVNQLTARLDVSVKVVVVEDKKDVTSENSDITLTDAAVVWSNINDNASASTNGNDGSFTTTIDQSYNVINRAYSYAGATPTLSLKGKLNGNEYSRDFKIDTPLKADNVYVILMTLKYDKVTKTTISLNYEVVAAQSIEVNVPTFE